MDKKSKTPVGHVLDLSGGLSLGSASLQIIALNGLVLLAQIFVDQSFGSAVVEAAAGLELTQLTWQIWRFFTYAFLQSGIGGFLFTSLAVFLVGFSLERLIAPRNVWVLYLVCVGSGGVAALIAGLCLPSYWADSHFLMGASTGVLGLMAALTVLAADEVISIWLIVFIPIRASYVWWLLLVGTIVTPVSGMSSRIEGLANLAGFLVGTVVARRFETTARLRGLLSKLIRHYHSRSLQGLMDLRSMRLRYQSRHLKVLKPHAGTPQESLPETEGSPETEERSVKLTVLPGKKKS